MTTEAEGVSDTGWQPLRRVPRTRSSDPTTLAFARLAVTHGLVTGGDTMVTVALAGSLFFSISPTAAQSRVAFSLLFTMLPFGVVAPFLGPAIDRSKGGRRIMLVGAAAGRVVVALLMARWVNSLLLFPSALAMLILSKTHAVVKASMVPSVVRSSDGLVEANGKLAMLSAIVGFAAAAPASGVLKLFGAAWVLRLAAVVYVAGTVAALRLRPAAQPLAVTEHVPPTAEETGALNRGVTLAATSMAALRAVVGFLTFAVAFEFRRTHAPTWWFGIVLGGSLFGGFAGAFLGPRLRTVLREEHILAGSVWVVAVVALIAGRFASRPALSFLALTVGLCAGTARLAFDAIVQRDAADAVRSRSFARFEATFQLAWVVAALIPVVVHIPTRPACFVLALGMAIAGLSYVTGRRALRHGQTAGPLQRRRMRPPPGSSFSSVSQPPAAAMPPPAVLSPPPASSLSPRPPVLPPGEA